MEEDEKENENFNESGEYSNKSEFSKAEVVKLQVERCNINSSKEMREGYYNYDKIGNRIYIPDSRKEFVRSVMALRNILRPEILRNPEIFDDISFRDKEKKLIETWGVTNDKGEKYIPQLDERSIEQKKRLVKGVSTGEIVNERATGKFNKNFNNYWDDMVLLYDEIYSQLHVLIDKCDYFKQQVSY